LSPLLTYSHWPVRFYLSRFELIRALISAGPLVFVANEDLCALSNGQQQLVVLIQLFQKRALSIFFLKNFNWMKKRAVQILLRNFL
jgi:hypothetical protein